MGTCTSKPPKPNPYAPSDTDPPPQLPFQTPSQHDLPATQTQTPKSPVTPFPTSKASPFFPFYTPSPFKKTPFKSTTSTPLRFFKKSFAPPSPAKHIKAVLRRQNKKKKKSGAEPNAEEDDDNEEAVELDKRFGFSKEFTSRLEVGEEVGRGHFGYTCSAKFKKGERKGQQVAVKVIPKSKVGTLT
jgi:hypothetical protein